MHESEFDYFVAFYFLNLRFLFQEPNWYCYMNHLINYNILIRIGFKRCHLEVGNDVIHHVICKNFKYHHVLKFNLIYKKSDTIIFNYTSLWNLDLIWKPSL